MNKSEFASVPPPPDFPPFFFFSSASAGPWRVAIARWKLSSLVKDSKEESEGEDEEGKKGNNKGDVKIVSQSEKN